jgi:hypothetical protein
MPCVCLRERWHAHQREQGDPEGQKTGIWSGRLHYNKSKAISSSFGRPSSIIANSSQQTIENLPIMVRSREIGKLPVEFPV